MNTWQLCKELRRRLVAARWPNQASLRIFASSHSVIISVAPEANVLPTLRMPAAQISPLGFTVDEQEPGLQDQRIRVRLWQQLGGDAYGQTTLIGGYADTSEGSPGRGLLEVETEMLAELRRLSRDEGVEIQLAAGTAAGAVMLESMGYIAWRDYEFGAWVTDEKSFPPARELLASTSGNDITLTWVNPFTSRFDFRRMRLRAAIGGTPPATITAGNNIAIGDTATTVTDVAGAVLISYSLFAAYDDLGDTVSDDRQISIAETITVDNT